MGFISHLLVLSVWLSCQCGCLAYFADWSSLAQDREPLCVDIPRNLTLCHDIGYTKMRLPNLLDHDTMQEVSQQASSWIPLLNIKCHADTKLFLCSLFAPVCLERPIYPCRSLCQKVESGCESIMSTYGFPWPSMLDCNKFPVDNDMCITAQSERQQQQQQEQQQQQRQHHSGRGRTTVTGGGGGSGTASSGAQKRKKGSSTPSSSSSTNCTSRPCNQAVTYENILDNYCQADFVVKMKFRRARGRSLQGRKANTVFKTWRGTPQELRRLRKPRLRLDENSQCCADWIKRRKNKQQRYLVMGKKGVEGSEDEGELVATFLLPWSKKRDLKRARRMFKRIDCSNLRQASQRILREAFSPRSPFADDPQGVHRQRMQRRRRRGQHGGGLFVDQEEERRRRKKVERHRRRHQGGGERRHKKKKNEVKTLL